MKRGRPSRQEIRNTASCNSYQFRKNFGLSATDRATDPCFSKICPVCGKEANVKYLDETRKVWVYRHKRLFAETIVHEAKS